MTDLRDKLVQLIQMVVVPYFAGEIADLLIANGLIFETDRNVGHKWISVDERLPEKYYETDEAYFGEPIEFIVHIAGAECATTLCFNGTDFFDINTEDVYEVTHWTPLPEPPQEE